MCPLPTYTTPSLAVHDGLLAQMGTGEGKTLVATCAVYLNALSRQGALLVTVNDFLARRDAETMGQVSFLRVASGAALQCCSAASVAQRPPAAPTYYAHAL